RARNRHGAETDAARLVSRPRLPRAGHVHAGGKRGDAGHQREARLSGAAGLDPRSSRSRIDSAVTEAMEPQAPGAWGFCLFQGGFRMAQVESRARATSDPDARREALKRLQDENVDFLLLWFTDIEGHLKSFAVTPSEVEEALNDGMGFDGSSITGFNAIEESDMVAIPD